MGNIGIPVFDTIDEIEKLARDIIEEIVAEQTKDYGVNKIEENIAEDIVTFELEEEKSTKSKVIVPLFGQKATISTIIVKIEDGEILVTEWTKWDLSVLGKVVRVEFNLVACYEGYGSYGLVIPAYFAYDDVAVRFEK